MEAHEGEFGPVDIAVIAYPAGAPMTGEAADLLVDLVDRRIIRVLELEELEELGQLHQQGVLTDEEFAAQKATLLG